MTMVATYPVDLECPRCRRKGDADAHEVIGGKVDRYTILPLTGSFILVSSSATPDMAVVQCLCGFEFYA